MDTNMVCILPTFLAIYEWDYSKDYHEDDDYIEDAKFHESVFGCFERLIVQMKNHL